MRYAIAPYRPAFAMLERSSDRIRPRWAGAARQTGEFAVSLGGIRNLDYTILLCGKMDETRAFYRDVMKFPIETDLKIGSVSVSVPRS